MEKGERGTLPLPQIQEIPPWFGIPPVLDLGRGRRWQGGDNGRREGGEVPFLGLEKREKGEWGHPHPLPKNLGDPSRSCG